MESKPWNEDEVVDENAVKKVKIVQIIANDKASVRAFTDSMSAAASVDYRSYGSGWGDDRW